MEDLFVDRLQEAVLDLEALVQRLRRCIRVHQDGFFEQLQQHFVEPAEIHDRAVVALHELLDGERVARVFVAQHLGELDLVIEQQPVFAAPGQNVQRETHAPQERLPFVQPPHLARREKLVRDQFIESLDAEMPFGDPADHLDVAQAAGTALYVRFEVVAGVVVAMVPRDLFLAFFREELRGGQILSGPIAACMASNSARAREQARLHQRRRDGQVGCACSTHCATVRTL